MQQEKYFYIAGKKIFLKIHVLYIAGFFLIHDLYIAEKNI